MRRAALLHTHRDPLLARYSLSPAADALTPEDRAAVDAFRVTRAAVAALRNAEPWTPGTGQDIAVKVGPFLERARTRPGTTTAPTGSPSPWSTPTPRTQRPTSTAAGSAYTDRGWLRCETTEILGT
ncbi:hypothetical protein ACFV6E_30265 [Streptomyces sp. NPDC059785]|uniref:hypothetical protein n=1 Tax=unclassified Streptomyces TaxID=2593676 RepID=UPI003666E86E